MTLLKHKTKSFALLLIALIVGISIFQACSDIYFFRSNYTQANKILHEEKSLGEKFFLKAHTKNGNVYILKDTWSIDTVNHRVVGKGIVYDFNREKIQESKFHIPIDSVAIFETNKSLSEAEYGRIGILTIFTAVNLVGVVYCQANPKACYGSCPTFYINEDDNFHYSDAEGFSNAISPSLEYGDIDALKNDKLFNHRFVLNMKNEALETHVVRDIKLIAAPRKNGEHIFQSPNDDFYKSKKIHTLTHATVNQNDITASLQHPDYNEYFSFADTENLSSKEELIITFDQISNNDQLGLVVDFRQTLMTTYFIYSAMGYMGDEVSDMFAELERNPELAKKLDSGIKSELGNIDIYTWDENSKEWIFQNGLYETGPIAINRQIVPLNVKSTASPIKIKIIMNKGLWRLDYIGLAKNLEKVEPYYLSPSQIDKNGNINATALANILHEEKQLISMPGDRFKLYFDLPTEHQDYELFLYSKGYYLEWMRENWLAEKNMFKLNQMLNDSKSYLRSETKAYKEYEKTMEQQFWNSKINTKSFTYHENK